MIAAASFEFVSTQTSNSESGHMTRLVRMTTDMTGIDPHYYIPSYFELGTSLELLKISAI